MNTSRCISVPVSWLRLEMHHLGELDESESKNVESHLEQCPVCRQCAASIREESMPGNLAFVVSGREESTPGNLAFVVSGNAPARPESDVVEDRSDDIAPTISISEPRRRRWMTRATAAVAATTAIAAAVLLMPRVVDDTLPGPKLRVKGGDVVITLLRERRGATVEAPTVFEAGDRFKVLLTCPPSLEEPRTAVVFQNGEASFPLRSSEPPTCGNRAAWPGAFRITGAASADVCVVWGQTAEHALHDAGALTEISDLRGKEVVCQHLEPAND